MVFQCSVASVHCKELLTIAQDFSLATSIFAQMCVVSIQPDIMNIYELVLTGLHFVVCACGL